MDLYNDIKNSDVAKNFDVFRWRSNKIEASTQKNLLYGIMIIIIVAYGALLAPSISFSEKLAWILENSFVKFCILIFMFFMLSYNFGVKDNKISKFYKSFIAVWLLFIIIHILSHNRIKKMIKDLSGNDDKKCIDNKKCVDDKKVIKKNDNDLNKNEIIGYQKEDISSVTN